MDILGLYVEKWIVANKQNTDEELFYLFGSSQSLKGCGSNAYEDFCKPNLILGDFRSSVLGEKLGKSYSYPYDKSLRTYHGKYGRRNTSVL